jgi:hypothetical protein
VVLVTLHAHMSDSFGGVGDAFEENMERRDGYGGGGVVNSHKNRESLGSSKGSIDVELCTKQSQQSDDNQCHRASSAHQFSLVTVMDLHGMLPRRRHLPRR